MAPNILRNNNNSNNTVNSHHHTDHVHDILKDDETGKNQRFVDDLLTKEMLKLSVKDRNEIQEEIHGVRCLAVEETDELIQTSLHELHQEITHKIPDSQKRAYLTTLPSQSPEPVTSSSVPKTNSPTTNINRPSSSYVHGDEFRLRFLRCDLFDIPKAARRLVTYLDLLVELFGEYALQRPISLSDFTKEELRHMRKGMIQPLPYRDRSGRRIMIAFPEEEVSQIPPFVKAKIAMYMLWAAGDQDLVTQKLGIIVIPWFDASFAKLSTSWKIKYKFYTLNCDRITAIHCCSPDTPHYRFRRSIMVMRCGVENRSKLIFHLGESMEIHYQLQGYGIPFEHVPISWTGKVKVQYLKQWMRIRLAVEKSHCHNCNHNHNNSSSGGETSGDEHSVASSSGSASDNIIECPQLQDVVFRQGTSGVSHPGNVTFRSLIESTVLTEQYKQHEREKEEQRAGRLKKTSKRGSSSNSSNNSNKKPKPKRPKQLAQEIYEKQKSATKGRFLIWNNEKGWWNKLTDKEQICMKIEYMVREFQKVSQKRTNFYTNHNKKKHNTHTHAETYPPFVTSSSNNNNETNTTITNNKKIVFLQSGTSLFRSQDGETASPFFCQQATATGQCCYQQQQQ